MHPHPLFNKFKKGFSLAETMMQLVILTIVTVPMLMTLNIQKNNIVLSKYTTTDKILAAQLFDRVNVQDSDPIDHYTVGTFNDNNNNTDYYSVSCDPAVNANCTPLQEATGPYFTRTISFLTNGEILVSVNLFHTQQANNNSNPSYFQASREYQLDTYRVAVSPNNTVQIDSSGNMWYPENTINPAAAGPAVSLATYLSLIDPNSAVQVSIPKTITDKGNLDVPFQNYRDISNQSLLYIFKAMPNKTYDVNFYFVLPQNEAINLNCLSNIANASCALANIYADSLKNDFSNDTYLNGIYGQQYLDLNALTGMQVTASGSSPSQSMGYILHDTMQTTNNTGYVSINIQPTSLYVTPGQTTHAYLSAIEMIRRDTQ